MRSDVEYSAASLCVVCPVLYPARPPRRPSFIPVCSACRTRVRGELSEIPDLYALIPAELEPHTGTGVRVSGTRTPPLPVRLDALNLLVAGPVYQVHDPYRDQYGTVPPVVVLDLWVRDWIDVRQRHEHEPVPHLATLVGWLVNRLDWALDYHPAIDEFAREVNQTVRAIRGVVANNHTGQDIGRCPARLRDDSRCGNRLYADPYLDLVSCGRCGSSWERRKWLHLAAEQEDARAEAA